MAGIDERINASECKFPFSLLLHFPEVNGQ